VGLAALAIALLVPVAVGTQSMPALGALGMLTITVGIVVFGAEVWICLAGLVALGLFPFIDPLGVAAGNAPYWLFGFALAGGLMVATFVARTLAGESMVRPQLGVLLGLTAALFLYTFVILSQSSPLEVPTLAAPFIALPLGALLTFMWLLHDEALVQVQRALPVVIVAASAWAFMYVVGSTGQCSACQQWVGTYGTNAGLFGAESRLYTWGQEAFLVLAVLAVARALYRPSTLWTTIACLGMACTVLQNSRAQDVAVFGGLLVLLIWRLSTMRAVARLMTAALGVLAFYAVLSSSVGEHIVNGYQGLSQGSGTGAYRLGLLSDLRQDFSMLGLGVSQRTVDAGYNVDLGIPNTVLILGWVGAVLQTVILCVAFIRSLLVRSATGVAFAAVMAMLLLSRPSLPILETGPGSAATGVALGITASLYVRAKRRAALHVITKVRVT